jgi:hypothetical protein
MQREKGLGLGLLSVGLMIVGKSGMAVDGATSWAVLGLVLMLLGVVLLVISRSPKPKD